MAALGTRGVLAIVIMVLLTAGVVSNRLGRRSTGIWFITGAFAFGTAWAGLSLVWARDNPSMVPADSYLAMVLLALSATVFYGYKAINGIGLTERL